MPSIIDYLSFALGIVAAVAACMEFKKILPASQVQVVRAVLNDTAYLANFVLSYGAEVPPNNFRVRLDSLTLRFAVLRTRSNRADGLIAQIGAAIGQNLSWDLFALHREIAALRRDVEIVLDEAFIAPPARAFEDIEGDIELMHDVAEPIGDDAVVPSSVVEPASPAAPDNA